jgi:hypothetical protein
VGGATRDQSSLYHLPGEIALRESLASAFFRSPLMRTKMFGHFIWTIAALGGLVMSLIYVFQDKLLYVSGAPADARTTFIRPERFNIRNHEDLYIPTPDGEIINCWFLRVEENYRQAPTMLYFHGNAGSILQQLSIKPLLHPFAQHMSHIFPILTLHR